MMEVFFTACLLDAPQKCRDHALQFAEMTELQCMAVSQQEIAKWRVVHPNWQITRWGCRRAGEWVKI